MLVTISIVAIMFEKFPLYLIFTTEIVSIPKTVVSKQIFLAKNGKMRKYRTSIDIDVQYNILFYGYTSLFWNFLTKYTTEYSA